MKVKKLVGFNLLSFILLLNTLFIYLISGFIPFSMTREYAVRFSILAGQILLILVIVMLVNLSYAVSYAKYKKNLLRIPLFVLVIVFLASIIRRTIDFSNGFVCKSCIFNTVLYLILILILISMLKDLYKLVRKLFLHKKKD